MDALEFGGVHEVFRGEHRDFHAQELDALRGGDGFTKRGEWVPRAAGGWTHPAYQRMVTARAFVVLSLVGHGADLRLRLPIRSQSPGWAPTRLG